MKNIKLEVLKSGLVQITFDPKASHGPSASGKTTVVATTSGNIDVPGFPGLKVGVNAYGPKAEEPAAPAAAPKA